jgi:hypothetical protein
LISIPIGPRTALADTPPKLKAVADRIEQVILNLILNAKDAMLEGRGEMGANFFLWLPTQYNGSSNLFPRLGLLF